MRRNAMRATEYGFTLAEILIVVVIIGILAAFVLPNLFGQAEDARIKITASQVASLSSALQAYNVDHNGKFPTTDQGLDALLERGEKGPYLQSPQLPKDGWENSFRYMIPGEKGVNYDLWSPGPDGISGTPDDIGNW